MAVALHCRCGCSDSSDRTPSCHPKFNFPCFVNPDLVLHVLSRYLLSLNGKKVLAQAEMPAHDYSSVTNSCTAVMVVGVLHCKSLCDSC